MRLFRRRRPRQGPSTIGRAEIFLNYRRDDTRHLAALIFDRLNSRFPEKVFMDVHSIDLGGRFESVIAEKLEECRAFIVLIGSRWLEEESGQRLHDPEDLFTREIETALNRSEITVIPVLVDDAAMPQEHELPDRIAALVKIQALHVSFKIGNYDLTRLTSRLDDILAPPDEPTEQIPPVIPPHPGGRPERSRPHSGRRRVALGIVALALIAAIALLIVVPRMAPSSPTNDFFARAWPGTTARVVGASWNVREEANNLSTVVGTARGGRTFAIKCMEGGWAKLAIPWPGKFVHSRGLEMAGRPPRC